MEHQLEMLLGEKKCTGSLPILSMNERTKEEIDALYNHLSSLNCVNDL